MWHKRERHCAGCLSGEGTARELDARMLRAALVVIRSYPMHQHRAGGSSLSFGARHRRDMPAAGSDAPPAFAWYARASATAQALSREKRQHAT